MIPTARGSINSGRLSLGKITPRSNGEENISSEMESEDSGRDRFREMNGDLTNFIDKTPTKSHQGSVDRFTELYESAMAL